MKSTCLCIVVAALAAGPLLPASEVTASVPGNPEIEFRVLLVIKRRSDTYSPLFLPVRSSMTDAEVAQARRCFEIETPDMVRDITGGKVRFVPTVVVSEEPLKIWDPKRLDSAEYYPPELLNEFYGMAKPGDFDSIGCYFLHYDSASGYRIPRAGFGVGGFDGGRGLGMFAINCTPNLNPRDEIFLHEWMHGLDGFYGSKGGVKLPRGMLHGGVDHGHKEKPWRAGDTFRGWMEWYRDYLTGTVREGEQLTGLGDLAWKHGPMRLQATKLAGNYKPTELPNETYPAWVHELMKGNLAHAVLGPQLLEARLVPGSVSETPWRLNLWNPGAGTQVRILADDGGTFSIHSPSPNNARITRTLPLMPFKNYVFVAEVRTEGVEITEKGGRFGANLSAGDSVSTIELTGTKRWTKVVLPFTTGAKPESCRLEMALGGSGSVARGRAFFRNVQVRQVGYPDAGTKPR